MARSNSEENRNHRRPSRISNPTAKQKEIDTSRKESAAEKALRKQCKKERKERKRQERAEALTVINEDDSEETRTLKGVLHGIKVNYLSNFFCYPRVIQPVTRGTRCCHSRSPAATGSQHQRTRSYHPLDPTSFEPQP